MSDAVDRFGALVARSPAMRDIFARARRIAASEADRCVLIDGEPGTGRQSLARAIHDASPRARGPFVVLDCRRIPRMVVDNALFGTLSTAFSGRRYVRPSPFEDASGGTLVLHEVAALFERRVQHLLARTIGAARVQHVGDSATHAFDTNVIVTTSRDIDEMLDHDSISEELFRELKRSQPILLPPLRERTEDIGPMLESFLVQPALATPELVARLEKLRWPSNVAELRRFSFAMAAAKVTRPTDGVASALSELELLDAIEKDPSDDALRQVYGDLLAARGDSRGEFIHLQCEAAHGEPERRAELEKIARQLLDRDDEKWTGRVRAAASLFDADQPRVGVTWDRGFVAGVRTTADVLVRLTLLFDAAPLLTSLELVGREGDVDSRELPFAMLTSPLLRRLRSLTMRFASNEVIDALASAWHLEPLERLEIDSQADRDAEPLDFDYAKEVLLASIYLTNATIIVDGVVIQSREGVR